MAGTLDAPVAWVKRLYHRFSSPKHFYELGGKMLPWLWISAALLIVVGTVWGLAFAPPDYQQGNSFRIIYIHVPAASIAMSAYALMAVAGAIVLVWKIKVAEMVVASAAPIGASFAAIALLTGAIWGKPTWGTYWTWDARLTSMLVLFFLYVGVIALKAAIDNPNTAARAASILSLVGVVNIPIIKYSVNWWNTLHQPATFTMTEKPAMPPDMYLPLIVMIFGCYLFFGAILIMQTRNEILGREYKSRWVQKIVTDAS